MKKAILLLIGSILSLSLSAQKMNAYLRERAEKNLQILAKDNHIKERVIIDNRGIMLVDQTYKRDVEVSAHWVEIGKVIDVLESSNYYEKLKIFEHKKGKIFAGAEQYIVDHYSQFPKSFDGLYVALDPGHFGGDLESARMEARLVKISAADMGTKQDVVFSEADIAYCTALFLKQMLEERGAYVMITRPYGAGAIGEDFSSWISTGGFLRSVNLMYKNKDISKEYFDLLNGAYKEKDTNGAKRNELFQFYKFVDFKERANKINEFTPNITISIHYNAHDDNKFYGDRYLHPVQDNYNMMFVPGAFLFNELTKEDQKLDFLRLLLSPDIENSITLADLILQEHEAILGVPRRTDVGGNSRMDKSVIYTDKPGVYARNLVLTRMPRGTVVYGESLLQDNFQEALLLGKRDITVTDPSVGTLPTSSRVKQVALAYFKGIERWLQLNVEKQQYYESLTSSIDLKP